jgi:hypothetical protein
VANYLHKKSANISVKPEIPAKRDGYALQAEAFISVIPIGFVAE